MLSSTQNTKIKHIYALQTTTKARKKHKQYIVEGKKTLIECPKEDLVELYMTEIFSKQEQDFLQQIDVPCRVVNEAVFRHISTSVTPQGVLGVIKQRQMSLTNIKLPKEPLIVALENLQDPGNIGTIIRTCDAAKVDAVLLSSGSVDIYNPKVVRATMGALFRVPIIVNCVFEKAIKELKDKGITIYAAHLDGATMHFDTDMTKGSCILIGNEGNGLSKTMTDLSDINIKIPMFGKTESLNASVAASILIYEAIRQRMEE